MIVPMRVTKYILEIFVSMKSTDWNLKFCYQSFPAYLKEPAIKFTCPLGFCKAERSDLTPISVLAILILIKCSASKAKRIYEVES